MVIIVLTLRLFIGELLRIDLGIRVTLVRFVLLFNEIALLIIFIALLHILLVQVLI